MKKSILLSRSFAKAKLQATSLWLVAAIIAMAFTACTKKSDTQMQTVTTEQTQAAVAPSNPYPEIRNGDLSAFAGIWENPYGSIHLGADGSLGSGTVGNFEWGDGVYVWYIYDGYNSELQEYQYSTGVMLYSAGIEIRNDFDYEIVQSDTTKVRIAIGRVDTSAQIYYRQGEAAIANSSNHYAKILSGDFSAFAGTWVTGEGRTNPLNASGVFGNGNAYNFKEIDSGYFEWIVNWGGEAGEVPIRLYPAGVEVYNTWTGSRVQTNTAKDRITVMDVVRNDEVYYQPDYHVQFKGETIYMTFTLLPQMSGNKKIGDILTYLNFTYYEDKQHQIDLEYLGPISYTGPGSINISAGDYNSDGYMDLTLNGVIVLYNPQTNSYPTPNDPYANYSPQGSQ
jgi:hypothetical protein